MSAAEGAPLDGKILEGLRVCGGLHVLRSTLTSVIENLPKRIGALGEAVRRGNLEETARAAHSLRGSAGTVGALGIVRACARLEEQATAGQAAALPAGLAELEGQWPAVMAALQAELTRVAGRE